MPTSKRFSGPARSFRYIVRSGAYALATVGALFCAVLLALRFHFYPKIEEYRPEIANVLARVIGHPVALGGVRPGWDGWNPRLTLADLTISSDDGTPLMRLPQVDAVVSWRWVLVGQLRMKVLTIDRPSLLVRRDTDGHIHVAGGVVDEAHADEDSGFVDWVLRQRVVNIRDGTLVWLDERRGAAPLRLERLALRLESGLGRYRFGLRGTPAAELASPVDLRGDLHGDPRRALQGLRGEVYARVDYADLAAWQQWVPMPVQLERGSGGARVWLELDSGRIGRITADFDLGDAHLRLGGAEPLALERLSGRLRVRDRGAQREIAAEGVTLRDGRGEIVLAGSSTLLLGAGDDARVVGGSIRVAPVLIEPAAKLVGELPIPDDWGKLLAGLTPRGTIEQANIEWQGAIPEPDVLRANADFRDVSIASGGMVPALSGANGTVELTEKGGTLRMTARDARLVLPKVFGEPVPLDVVAARAQWERVGGQVALTVQELTFGNEHAAGTLAGVYRSEAKGPGYADLTASLSRGDARYAYRYVPTAVAPAVRDWLRYALRAGTVREARLRLRGRLADFPFTNGKGEFRAVAKGDGGELQYADGWPRVTGIRAEVAFDGARMRITGDEGRVLGAAVGRTEATVPDLGDASPRLQIEGTATGPTREFLRFIDESPVHRWINRFTDGVQAAGDGRLALRLELPLANLDATRVAGQYAFQSNRVTLGPDIPIIDGVEGTVAFTERGISGDGLTGTVLGGPVRVGLASAEGRVRVTAEGSADMTAVARAYPHPLAPWVSGRSPWTIVADVGAAEQRWELVLNMTGVTVDLPPPLGKAPDARVPLRIERTTLGTGGERVAMRYGADDDRIAELKLIRRGGDGRAGADAALLTFGRTADEPPGPGLRIRGTLPALDVDRWLAVREVLPAPGGGSIALGEGALAVQDVDLEIGSLGLFGRWIHDVKLTAQIAERWRFDVDAREMTGALEWAPPRGDGTAGPAGRLTARLSRLELQHDAAVPEVRARPGSEESTRDDPRSWPAVDLVADSVVSKGRNLGLLRVKAEPRGDAWRVLELSVTNPDGDLRSEGWWRGVPIHATEMNVVLTVRDAGAFLVRYGHAGAVKGAPTVIKGHLAWAGGPQQFDFPTLEGALRIDSGAGQFTRLDPGIGKLLGVLSLQALPRRMTLDFRDVFSEGFAFDELNGDVRIDGGVMTTDNLQFNGPAARVALAGQADLAAETQDLNVRVQPTLSTGIALGAAIGLANPAIGAAVLLGQKILQDPVEKMFATRYRITGDWEDPQVARLSVPPAETAVTDLR